MTESKYFFILFLTTLIVGALCNSWSYSYRYGTRSQPASNTGYSYNYATRTAPASNSGYSYNYATRTVPVSNSGYSYNYATRTAPVSNSGYSYNYATRTVPVSNSGYSYNYATRTAPVSNSGYSYNYRTYPVSNTRYAYNYGAASYPVSNQAYVYQAPCRSSCNQPKCSSSCNTQPTYTSQCQKLPCSIQQQPHYASYPYPYYGNSNTGTITSNDPYANIPAEIIDDESVTGQNLRTLPINTNAKRTTNEYDNVPLEVIDVDPVDFWRNIPRLPKVTKSSQSNYSVSQGGVTSNTITESKPVKAVITRSFQPLQKNPEVRLDFLNGESVNTNGEDSNEESENNDEQEATTEAPVTTTVLTTTEESEDVAEVKSWF